jgi:cyclopentanol dehydrogenase
MDRLKGKVALISGGARGQGAAEARLFASEGAKVVIGDVRDDLTRQTADAINAKCTNSVRGLEQTSEEEWDAMVNVNQKGVWLGMKAAVPAMRQRGGGSIINISSIYGLIGSTGSTAYHGTKGAVRLLTKAAAVQYAREKIRVNSIHPGLIHTPMVEDALPTPDALPMGRGAQPDEVGWCVLFLASDEASYVTGAELAVDGGYSAM